MVGYDVKAVFARQGAKAQRKPRGRFMNALLRNTDFDFAFSAQLTIFGFDPLCALARGRVWPFSPIKA
jgi:hypothetical protein